ncbi:2OG-Fe(II) oxygenase family protein [bacterium]|nr:2OG-Fe(II) oxygenase family protein [bacterium]
MKIINQNIQVFKQKIENYKEINEKLLNWFEEVPQKNFGTDYNVSKTDFKTSEDMNRPYVKYLVNEFTPYINKIGEVLRTEKCAIPNLWFQQYLQNDSHSWHNHGEVNWVNIYFVELPETLGTEFLDFEIKDIQEGDLLTFPAQFIHRAPKNSTKHRKTIVSFNSNYTDYKEA